MRRPGRFLLILAGVLLLGGCAVSGHRGGIYVQGTYSYEGYDGPRERYYYDRVEEDVRRYLNRLDRQLRLSTRQERHLHQMLTNRTYDLLQSTRPGRHQEIYPFPRRFDGRQERAAERWWNQSDRRIEESLTRRQARAYRQFTRPTQQGRRYYRYERGNG